MKNKALVLFITAVIGLAFASNAIMAQDKPAEKKEPVCAMQAKQDSCKGMICPVTGEAANKEVFTDYMGQKVYFCCDHCKAAFEKDPAKYEAKIHKCTGECKKAAADSCCKADEKKCSKADSCCKADAKMGEKAMGCCKSDEKMSDKAKGCKETMVCPVSGKPGNKEFFSEYKGQKVYFCCPACKPEFEKEPEKYLSKLPKFAK